MFQFDLTLFVCNCLRFKIIFNNQSNLVFLKKSFKCYKHERFNEVAWVVRVEALHSNLNAYKNIVLRLLAYISSFARNGSKSSGNPSLMSLTCKISSGSTSTS